MSSNQTEQTNLSGVNQLNISFFQRMEESGGESDESRASVIEQEANVGADNTAGQTPKSTKSKKKSTGKNISNILKQSDKHLVNIISKEVKFKDFTERMLKSKQENILVKEILIESELDYVNSLKQLKSVFKTELQTAINQVNSLYQNELSRLKQLYQSAVVGESLIEIIKAISGSEWYLLMKDNSVNAYKFYNPPFEVTSGYYNSGKVLEYNSTICMIRGIYVNILHPKITYGTIHLSTTGHHPNCQTGGFSEACPGTFLDREINLSDPLKLVTLLDEISATYEKIHLDSSYYKPNVSYELKEEYKWKAS
ncbi:MAG: hypothetical protein JST55_16445 [Bacteroidetes bacterium]|nr:hypothetical protein [Bacteroidota bacterium]